MLLMKGINFFVVETFVNYRKIHGFGKIWTLIKYRFQRNQRKQEEE